MHVHDVILNLFWFVILSTMESTYGKHVADRVKSGSRAVRIMAVGVGHYGLVPREPTRRHQVTTKTWALGYIADGARVEMS